MNRILMHKTQASDIDEIVSLETDDENSKFIFANSKEEHLKLIADKNIEHLVLRSKKKELIGFVILAGLESENRSIEFRRIVIKEKGKGFGRTAIQEIKRFCFEKLNSHRLWLDVLKNNKRALHLYQSEGFRKEGELRECILIEGEFKNLIIMSILEEEYKCATANKI